MPTFTGIAPPNILSAHPAPCITVRNCRGGLAVTDLSQAPEGGAVAEYCKRLSFGLNFGANAYEELRLWGKFVKLRVNVIRPYTGTGNAAFYMQIAFSYFTTAGIFTPIAAITDHIDVKIAGERVYLPGSVTGNQTTDVMTTIAAGGVMNGDLNFFFYSNPGRWDMPGAGIGDISVETQDKWPIIEIEAISDQGPIIKMAGANMANKNMILW
jgi:hypothetical protein